MISNLINYSLRHKFIVLLFVIGIVSFGSYSLMNIPIGAVPDITNNQVQVISTSRNLPTEEVERYLSYPVELALGNLPGVQEIRSISKFGLSVVTIVFDDKMGTYLPRQLISEKLAEIKETIPEGFGSPSMGPISTGLGEIYQYILDIKPGYEDRYDVTDLRTIQDWMVKRQLSGISGVVEINTWGGFLKTYEVAIDPIQMNSYGLSLNEVYNSLKDNNAVAGGGYIEKENESYFIRAEGLTNSIEDIENINVKIVGGTPIYIKDIGKVGFGSATRFGAITGNGEGEKVLGQIMMLKGANSKKVIDDVIQRVEEIQSSLPEGVFINPFLERSELISKTTFTIAENLILGFLIVLFVVVFLLGNLRSGLVVASVIPLTLLFALSLMYIFGVDANLMSLGAIDFGIIIDGAVIIVEYIAYSITKNASSLNSLSPSNQRIEKDNLVRGGASKMMHSAIFGQIIIIIVFIPILTLTGIEGKMFRPMALTFCFALLGAMILCFTYVPVVSSLFLKPESNTRKSISKRFIESLKNLYEPTLRKALRFRSVVLIIAIILFVSSSIIFSKMGGEFIPTLDEGDFVIQPILKTGMSLAETVKMTTRIEGILMSFPEVKQVVSRIGAAEVPTDPMSMEESDIIITLNKKSEWTSADTKDGLAEVFKQSISEKIPGIEIEFTQPIEMRFNELISGARSDLAIKLFGDDLNILYTKANEIEEAIKGVEGAADISVEKIDGLPQMKIKYDRNKIAKYGLNIDELNDLIGIGFAGKTAGIIYEGESKFDIVLKFQPQYRSKLEHLKDASITLPSGNQLPLSEFASIDYNYGPAKISRDDTKRRVVIGVNVRGRDIQSVVEEIQNIIHDKVAIPVGYNIQYGGQFENLQKATRRLMVAVPVSLLLIFILLYFAFDSVKEALLIFSAIPLATIGGILALYLRGMPFSISAGIGFIALFGIAVLNGIIMIEHFKELKLSKVNNHHEMIIAGALDRLRPVLLTAIAAALGFLPMAISSSAGAEVQRPLATVVIGGLFTATLLTLVVLPVLYSFFENTNKMIVPKNTQIASIIFIIFTPIMGMGQYSLTLNDVVNKTLENNKELNAAKLYLKKEKALIPAARESSKTEFYYAWDKNNITENGQALHVIGASHNFKLPSVLNAKTSLQEARVNVQESVLNRQNITLSGHAIAIYDRIRYLESVNNVYQQIDSILLDYLSSAEQKLKLGEASQIESLIAQQKLNEWHDKQKEVNWTVEQSYQDLKNLMQIDTVFNVAGTDRYGLLEITQDNISYQSELELKASLVELYEKEKESNATLSLPEIKLTVFNGFDQFNNPGFFPGFQAGISIPISKKQYKSRADADLIDIELARLELSKRKQELDRRNDYLNLKKLYLEERLNTYKNSIISTSENLTDSAKKGLQGGELDYFQFALIFETSLMSKLKMLEIIHDYNQTLISLNYLLN